MSIQPNVIAPQNPSEPAARSGLRIRRISALPNGSPVEPTPGDTVAYQGPRRRAPPRPLVPEVLVRKDEWALVRPRIGVEELIALDRMPAWL